MGAVGGLMGREGLACHAKWGRGSGRCHEEAA